MKLLLISISLLSLLMMIDSMNINIISKKKLATIILSSTLITSSLPLTSYGVNDISSLPIPTPIKSDVEPQIPTDSDNQLIQIAFRDYNLRRFDESEKEFTLGLQKWYDLNRPRDEIVSLLKARGNVRLDSKNFKESIQDLNDALKLMPDGEKEDGTGRYPEYVDTFVQRGLVYEGLAEWQNALNDYDKAIKLWGGGRGENVNPFVLVFRGNVLGRLNKWSDAAIDYNAASSLFLQQKDISGYSDARANEALALYQIGDIDNSVKAMNDVIRKNPGYADMHVALAADSWSTGNYIKALSEWRFACNDISTGCEKYKDGDWLLRIRRWPPTLVEKLQQFQTREIPKSLTDLSQERLAPTKVI